MARRYALVVGISQYKPPLKNLSKTVTDAEAVAAVLRTHGEFQEITLLIGEVTNAKLSEALRQLLSEQAKGNDALIYFTGHGIPVVDPLMGKPNGYLATSDCAITLQGTQVVEQQRGTAIASLNELIRASELSSLVVLLDCCHSGDFLERQLVERTFNAFSGRQDYCLITACRGSEQAYAKKREQHSIFTGALLEGLSEQRADEDGRVTGDSLSAHIKRELRGSGQEPISMGIGGTITLVSYGKQAVATQIDETCPYQGLEPFTEATQQFFFGRKPVVELLRQELEQSPFVALIGASGSGKSSVVRAGLIPWIKEAGWRVLDPIKPGFEPLSELKRTFASQFHRSGEIQQVHKAIASGSLDSAVALLPGRERVLLVVDQFEEVFTVCADKEERRSLIDLLTQLQSSRLAVVITMRADFLEPCLDYANLTQQLQQHTVLIPPLEGKALEEAIVKPAQKQGYNLEPALLTLIQRDIFQEKNCLPLLQFALQNVWNLATQAGHQLMLDHYEQLGGLAGALDRHGDRIYDYWDWREATPSQLRNPQEQDWIKRLCLKLVRTGEGTRDTRQRQLKTDLLALAGQDNTTQNLLEAVLTDLVHGRLLITDREETNLGQVEKLASPAYVDLAHEALMDSWKKFKEWRQLDRELRRIADRIQDDLRVWKTNNCNNSFLLAGGLLKQAHKNRLNLQMYLNPEAREFYQLSYNHELQKSSYAQEVNQVKEELRSFQAKVASKIQQAMQVDTLQEASKINTSSSQTLDAFEDDEKSTSTTNDNVLDLAELDQNLGNYIEELQLFEKRRQASHLIAEWLLDNQEKITEDISSYILTHAAAQDKLHLDFQELDRYMTWLYDSLRSTQPRDAELEPPSLPATYYAQAFNFFKQELISEELPRDAIEELHLYLDYLIVYFNSLV